MIYATEKLTGAESGYSWTTRPPSTCCPSGHGRHAKGFCFITNHNTTVLFTQTLKSAANDAIGTWKAVYSIKDYHITNGIGIVQNKYSTRRLSWCTHSRPIAIVALVRTVSVRRSTRSLQSALSYNVMYSSNCHSCSLSCTACRGVCVLHQPFGQIFVIVVCSKTRHQWAIKNLEEMDSVIHIQ